jgi:Flp pilus assembly protein TadG
MLLAPIAVKVETTQYGAVYAAPDATTAPKGATVTIPVALRNTGGLAWQPAQVYLSYHLIAASGSVYVWDGARTAIVAPVATNGVTTLQAQVRVPTVAGTFEVRWDLVHEGVSWFSGKGVASASTALTVQ